MLRKDQLQRDHKRIPLQKNDRRSVNQEWMVTKKRKEPEKPGKGCTEDATVAFFVKTKSNAIIAQCATTVRAKIVKSESTDRLAFEVLLELPPTEAASSLSTCTRYNSLE